MYAFTLPIRAVSGCEDDGFADDGASARLGVVSTVPVVQQQSHLVGSLTDADWSTSNYSAVQHGNLQAREHRP